MSDIKNLFKRLQQSWQRLKYAFLLQPQNHTELMTILKIAEAHKLIGQETLTMIEGVLTMARMQVRDSMIPRSQIIVLEQEWSAPECLKVMLEAGHSRFPVVGENKDDVIGILHVKDFLKHYAKAQEEFHIADILRPAYFVPESKRLDIILNEFKATRNHLAIVVDEYGGMAGLVTIEDVLEEIVGDIQDEFDTKEEASIQKITHTLYQLKSLTTLEAFNAYFASDFSDPEVDTIGGLIMKTLGSVPQVGEIIFLKHFEFKVLKSDLRRLYTLEVKILSNEADLEH